MTPQNNSSKEKPVQESSPDKEYTFTLNAKDCKELGRMVSAILNKVKYLEDTNRFILSRNQTRDLRLGFDLETYKSFRKLSSQLMNEEVSD